jgi:DNA-directed RNA polymerase specialized sigma24 family protein
MAAAPDSSDPSDMRSSLYLGGQDGGHRAAVHQPDLVLARWARAGDPYAFGVLYLRHHHAAWRMAHGASGFAHQCSEIVIEAFARLLRPAAAATSHSGSCRSELLAEVRRVAAKPSFSERRPELVVFGDEGEQEFVAGSPRLVDAFRQLDEPERVAWWLLEVERFTPRETAAVLRLDSGQVAHHHAKASRDLTSHLAAAATPAAACRPAAERIAAGGEPDEVTHRHLRSCPVCRMRREERLRPAVALCDAVPPMPLLGLECHRRWRTG